MLQPTIARTAPPRYPGTLRVTGTLAADAVLATSTGRPPRMQLRLHLQPGHGLPYLAAVDLGTDATDHMAADAMLPSLRTGALVSVAAESLELANDHGHAALRLVHPHTVLVIDTSTSTTRS